jgi:heme exporter protein CcmD
MNSGILAMGGYAGYVWPSVGLVLAVLVWNVWSAREKLAAARLRARRALEIKAVRS